MRHRGEDAGCRRTAGGRAVGRGVEQTEDPEQPRLAFGRTQARNGRGAGWGPEEGRAMVRRFNPEGRPWLPILHTTRGGRHYTALFSNTARAHELGTTDDWVIIYRDDDGDHGRWTVITSNFGRSRGRRIVRGREQECEGYDGGKQT